jgi:hypothetical protein
MSETPDLLSRFREIINKEPASLLKDGEQESVSVLYRTNWVRILVVHPLGDSQSIIIDVEVSPPYPSLSPNSSSSQATKQTNDDARQLLEQLIEHIKYILRLESSGFSIDFVGNDCLILVSQCFTKIPSADIFKLLLPPSTEK